MYYAHIDNAVKSGPITDGMTIGSVKSWTNAQGKVCNPGPHTHVEFKNLTGSEKSCYSDLAVNTSYSEGTWIGNLGAPGVTANQAVCPVGTTAGGIATTPPPVTDGTRVAKPSGAQYIFQRGAALPITSSSDAIAYNNEGNTNVTLNYSAQLPPATLPFGTMMRPVGSYAQYFWNGSQRLPVGDGATSACFFVAFPQGNGALAVVPADWITTLSQGPAAQCSLPDGTRFTQTDTGTQQYVSVRGAALAVGYSDAVAYSSENNTSVISMPAGYIQQSIHAPVVPANTVLRAANSSAQFFWDGSQLHSVGDTATSQCLLVAFPQYGVAVAPPSWVAARTQGAAQLRSLADGTRFVQDDLGFQQYVSVRGAALPVSYADAVRYNSDGNSVVLNMPAGYVQSSIHAAVLPINTVVRAVGNSAQYLWDGSALHYVPDGATSACLLAHYPQNGVAVAPADWMATLTIGANQSCN